MAKLKRILTHLGKNESGQGVLVIVLILLMLGAVILTPLLVFMSTGLKAGQVYESKLQEFYSADSGVEDALYWLPQLRENGGSYGPYTSWVRSEDYEINNREVGVTIGDQGDGIYLITSTATSEDGGSITIESYVESIPGGNLPIFDGALVSKGDISLGKNSTVTGDIYYGGTPPDPDNYVHIDGELIPVEPENFPSQEQDEAFAQTFKEEALLGGTLPGLTVDSDIELGPKYINGDLYIEGDVTINLTGTIYVEGSITAKKDYTVTGSGSIVAVGDIYLSKMADYGIEGDSVIMSLTGGITFKKEATIEALIYAPSGTIAFDKDATVIGGVVGADIQADKEGSFTYIPRDNPIELPGYLPASLEVKTYSINP